MVMKVKTNFAGEVMLEMESPTLKNVLIELFKEVGFSVYSVEDKEIRGDFKVYLNGVEYDDLTNVNNVMLKQEDEVEVTTVILVGG
jgi:GH43 family beta-xylosidase